MDFDCNNDKNLIIQGGREGKSFFIRIIAT